MDNASTKTSEKEDWSGREMRGQAARMDAKIADGDFVENKRNYAYATTF